MNGDDVRQGDPDQLELLVRQLDETQSITHIGTFVYDVAAGEVTWSAELYRIFGFEPRGDERLPNSFYFDRVHPDDLGAVAEVVEAAIADGGSARFAHRILRADGEERLVECTGTVIVEAATGHVRFVGTTYDVTDERRLADAYVREREAARHLVEIDALRSVFLNAVSHELRTPLTAILGFAITLDERRDAFDQEAFVGSIRLIREQAERLSTLLDDLLDIDLLRSGGVEPIRTLVDVAALIERSIAAADTRGRIIDVAVAGPIEAMLDGPKVERLVENLVCNAVKYTPEDERIEVRVWRDGDAVHLAVEDEGPGIPAAMREEVFEPFLRLEATADVRGTGIGLSLVRAFARLHGGDAWVEPRAAGDGSSFRVMLAD